jgi:hypothetical protein
MKGQRKRRVALTDIYVGYIQRNEGDVFLISRTESGLFKKVAIFCRDKWIDDKYPPLAGTSDKEVVEKYFEVSPDQFKWSRAKL